MSFFADRPGATPIEVEELDQVLPEWQAPPLGVLPGVSSQRATPFRTSDALMVVHRFTAFPTGVEFDVDVYMRHGQFFDIPLMVHHPRYREGDQFTDDVIRFGLQLSDGSSWSNLDRPPPDWIPSPDVPPAPPLVICNGGNGGGRSMSARYWLWPLPPEGPITFFAEWPSQRIAESSVTIDGTELRAAAARSERLW